ncbi:hypothetical protein BDR22DRAFT_827384 [Usnea florida]
MNQVQNMNCSPTSQSAYRPESANMPRRQAWDTADILCMGDDFTYADALKEIIYLWNEWADTVENILRGMIDQLEELDFTYDDYLTLVRQLALYPARPPLQAATDLRVDPDIYVSCVWNAWADRVEKVVNDMRRVIAHSVPLPREEQGMREGDLVDFSLDLSKQDPSPMHMAAHLRKVLGDGTVTRDDLADVMEDLRL